VRAEGLLYHARGSGGEAWVLGSLHFGSGDLYPLSESIQRAFAASDRLMVEVDLLSLDPEAVSASLALHGVLSEDDALRRHIPEELWQRLVRAARRLELPVRVIEQQRPWLAALTVTNRFLERNGLDARMGVDRHFMQRARRAGVPVLELETFESQMALLAGIPAQQQTLMLEDTLAQVDGGASMPMELLRAWREGDHVLLEELLFGGLGSTERGRDLMRRLLDGRNGHMAREVALEVSRGGTVFVVVGAAHLLGESGLPAALARRGLALQLR
jgi:uncharacterized protein YbaP (TraB family)